MKTYSDKSNCTRAARKALGKDAKPGIDFLLIENLDGGGWSWEPAPALVEEAPAAKKARTKCAPKPEREPRGPSKADLLLDRLHSDGGATAAALQAEFGWLPHTLRAAISVLGRKLGTPAECFKTEDGERAYRIPAKTQEAA